MTIYLKTIYFFIISLFMSKARLQADNTLLYNQLQISLKKNGKPNLDNWDRFIYSKSLSKSFFRNTFKLNYDTNFTTHDTQYKQQFSVIGAKQKNHDKEG